jgi:hypothetical protein
MAGPALVLLALLALDGEPPTLREQKPTGIWFQPQARFNALYAVRFDSPGTGRDYIFGSSVFPLGVEVGYQPWGRAMVSVAVAYDNSSIYRTIELTAGARRYLRDGVLAPYVAIELGVLDPRSHTDFFAVAGPGLELSLGNGLSAMADVQIGPENSGADDPSGPRRWHFSAWCRLGVGYRF